VMALAEKVNRIDPGRFQHAGELRGIDPRADVVD